MICSVCKTLTTVSATNFTYASATGYIPLDKSDIYSIDTVTVGGVDAKDKFTLDNGQRDNYYDEARLIPIGSQAAATLSVSFDYYEHGTGDYFSVDSYYNKALAAGGNAGAERYRLLQNIARPRDCLWFL